MQYAYILYHGGQPLPGLWPDILNPLSPPRPLVTSGRKGIHRLCRRGQDAGPIVSWPRLRRQGEASSRLVDGGHRPRHTRASCDVFIIQSIHSFCRCLAITGIMLVVVIVVMIVVVAFHCLHGGLVEHCTVQSLIHIWSGMKRVLDDVGSRSPPFDAQNEAVDQWRCRADVDDRCEPRKIAYDVVVCRP